jgi:hypothetical protein
MSHLSLVSGKPLVAQTTLQVKLEFVQTLSQETFVLDWLDYVNTLVEGTAGFVDGAISIINAAMSGLITKTQQF